MNDLAVVSAGGSAGEAQASAARPLALAELAIERSDKLPRDHPRQPGDAIALGARARERVGAMPPAPIGVLSFWDHAQHGAPTGKRRLAIDASGSYRLE
jgi:hypothetical protein